MDCKLTAFVRNWKHSIEISAHFCADLLCGQHLIWVFCPVVHLSLSMTTSLHFCYFQLTKWLRELWSHVMIQWDNTSILWHWHYALKRKGQTLSLMQIDSSGSTFLTLIPSPMVCALSQIETFSKYHEYNPKILKYLLNDHHGFLHVNKISD